MKLAHLLASTSLLALPLVAQSGFSRLQSITTGADRPTAIDTADLDSDGRPDVLSSSAIDNKIAWYRNVGGGRFGPEQTISTAALRAQSVLAADLDGDRALDVLTTSQTGGELAWHRNLGGGRFGPQQVISTGVAGCRDVTAADFDGDGDLDVAAIGSGAFNQVAWFENRGGGAFGPLRGIEPGNSRFIVGGVAIHAEDMDGDGAADVLVAASSNDVVGWYTNLLATAEAFGAGCGVQPLTQRPIGLPVLGTFARAEIRNAPGSLCVLMAGLDRDVHPFFGALPFHLDFVGMRGCALLQSGEVPAVPATPTGTPGVFTWSMPLAANPAFQGMAFYSQAFAVAPGQNQLGLIASNGVAWRLGL